MLEFARQPTAHRFEAFVQAGRRLNIRPYIVEKDFWVCWLVRGVQPNGERRIPEGLNCRGVW